MNKLFGRYQAVIIAISLELLSPSVALSQCPTGDTKIIMSDQCYWEQIGNPNSPILGDCVARSDVCTGMSNSRSNNNFRCDGRYRCEAGSPIACSGKLVPPGAKGVTHTYRIKENGSLGGILSGQFQVCQTLPQNKLAKEIYCQMYDHPNTTACNNDTNTSNTCIHTAFVRMKLNIVNENQKQYCWIFNSESVGGRPRDYTIYVETD